MGRRPKEISGGTGFGIQLRALRDKAGLTQGELAAQAGTTLNTVSRLELCTSEPSWPLVLALASALGVSVERFVVKPPRKMKESE